MVRTSVLGVLRVDGDAAVMPALEDRGDAGDGAEGVAKKFQPQGGKGQPKAKAQNKKTGKGKGSSGIYTKAPPGLWPVHDGLAHQAVLS